MIELEAKQLEGIGGKLLGQETVGRRLQRELAEADLEGDLPPAGVASKSAAIQICPLADPGLRGFRAGPSGTSFATGL